MPRRPGVLQALSGPAELVLVRHGESLGNVANQTAHDRGAEQLELEARDADIALSPTGLHQATALGQHLGDLPPGERPTVILSSPYARALSTATTACDVAGLGLAVAVDERLRERELGIMDGQTRLGIRHLYPEEAARREWLGKFYYRPPSGESWCDVLQRVRQLLMQLSIARLEGERVWVFTHQAVILAFRVAMEHISEQDILDIDASNDLANCSLTRYVCDEQHQWQLTDFGATDAVSRMATETHEEPADEERGDADGLAR